MERIPYGRQWIDEDDINAVVEVLRSDWLTTGPKVGEFEEAFAELTDAQHAVAFNNGTFALLAMMHTLDLQPGDEVIVPALTFAATASTVALEGGTPVFADVKPDTLLIDPASVEARITTRTRAVVAVDYAGQPCDYDTLQSLCDTHNLTLLADACHALGGRYKGRRVGSLTTMSAFSFHPIKPITTGEGGMVTTNDSLLAERLRQFRNHGIDLDFRARADHGVSSYDVSEFGLNGRLTDIQSALGLSQLKKLERFRTRRNEIAGQYREAFAEATGIRPLTLREEVRHAWHLFVVRVPDRDRLFGELRKRGIMVAMHYPPVHLFTAFRERYGYQPGLCPTTEQAVSEVLSLPIYPMMTDDQVERVINTLFDLI